MGTGSRPEVVWIHEHNVAEMKNIIATRSAELSFEHINIRGRVYVFDKNDMSKFIDRIEKFCSEIPPDLSAKAKIAYVNYNIHKLDRNYTLDWNAKMSHDIEIGGIKWLDARSFWSVWLRANGFVVV